MSGINKQVLAICQSLQKLSGISTEDGASMLACLNSCANVSEAGHAKLMQTIVEKTTDMGEQVVDFHSATAGGKSKLQDYSGLCKFISKKVWDLIMEPSRPACDVLTLICQWAALLGLVAPSEGTMGVLTAIAFWKQWRSSSVSYAAMHRTLQVSKKQIKEHLLYFNQQLPKDRPRLRRLPAQFDELPACLKRHFGDLLLGSHKCIFLGHGYFFLTVLCPGFIFFDLLFVISAGLYRCLFRPPVPVDLALEQTALKMPLRVSNIKSNEFLSNHGSPAGASLADNSSAAKGAPLQLEWLVPASRSVGATSQHAEITACADDSQEMEESGDSGSSTLPQTVPLKPADQLVLMSAKAEKLKPLLALPSVSKENIDAKVSVSVPALPGPGTTTEGEEKKATVSSDPKQILDDLKKIGSQKKGSDVAKAKAKPKSAAVKAKPKSGAKAKPRLRPSLRVRLWKLQHLQSPSQKPRLRPSHPTVRLWKLQDLHSPSRKPRLRPSLPVLLFKLRKCQWWQRWPRKKQLLDRTAKKSCKGKNFENCRGT